MLREGFDALTRGSRRTLRPGGAPSSAARRGHRRERQENVRGARDKLIALYEAARQPELAARYRER
ncbi:MAG TPA: hypothetical protein VHJ77_14080 [Vicinamibacterales bacterium]|nr:hypothetical protein [Vicinamibacterales bacterium]